MSTLQTLRDSFFFFWAIAALMPFSSAADSFDFLSELPESFCLDENVNAGTFGIRITDLNTAKVSESLRLESLQFQSREDFREALCEKLLNGETCLQAYALLNQLYPQYSCEIVKDAFWCSSPIEHTKVPIQVVSGNENIALYVRLAEFGHICRAYWWKRLEVRSELEKTLDESRPEWREELGLPQRSEEVPKPSGDTEDAAVEPCPSRQNDLNGQPNHVRRRNSLGHRRCRYQH